MYDCDGLCDRLADPELSQLTSAATAFTEDGWALRRHHVLVHSPEIDDSRMWRAQPATKKRRQ